MAEGSNSVEPSAFSFISSVEEGSSFSFLHSNPSDPSQISSFDFISSQSARHEAQDHILSSSHDQDIDFLSASTEIKLARTAQAKQVKKKKKASKVGFGRDEDQDDHQEEAAHPVIVAHVEITPVATNSLVNLSESNNSHLDNQVQSEPVGSSLDSIAPRFQFISEQSESIDLQSNLSPAKSSEALEPDQLALSHNVNLDNGPEVVPTTRADGAINVGESESECHASEIQDTLIIKDSDSSFISEPEPSRLPPVNYSLTSLSNFNQRIGCIVRRQLDIYLAKKSLRKQLEAAEQSQFMLKIRLTELDLEQSKFAQLEDFERADTISGIIDSVKNEIAEKTALVLHLKENEIELTQQTVVCREEYQSLLDEIVPEMVSQKLRQEVDLESSRIIEERRLAQEETRLKSEEERISLEKKHIDREEEALLEESTLTESAISSQCGAVQVIRNEKSRDLEVLNAEIIELEALLTSKKNLYQQLKTEIVDMDVKINDVRKKYERQLQRIHDRKEAIDSAKVDCLNDVKLISAERLKFDAESKNIQDTYSKMKSWCIGVDSEIAITELVKQTLALDIQICELDDADDLKIEVASAEASLLSAHNSEIELEDQIKRDTSEVAAISARIPILESEKKDHAVAKRFKEAALVAKDIKSLTSKREVVEENLLLLQSQKDSKASLVIRCKEKRDDSLLKLKKFRRQSAIARFSDISLRINQLTKVRSILDDPKDLSSHEDLILWRQGLRSLIEIELELLNAEVSSLSLDYGINQISNLDESTEDVDNSSLPIEDVEGPVSVPAAYSEDEVAEAQLSLQELLLQQKDLAGKLEAAVELDDFELAAEIDETLQAINLKLTTISAKYGLKEEDLS